MSDSLYDTRLHTVESFLNGLGHEVAPPDLEPYLAPNVIYTVPGAHRLSGRFSGIDEVTEHLNRLFKAVRNTFDVLQWEDRMIGVKYVSVLARLQMQFETQIVPERTIFLFGFDDRERIDSIEVFIENSDRISSTFH